MAACLAPSFPAEFVEMDYTQTGGHAPGDGVSLVVEVTFGADLVARALPGAACSRQRASLHLDDLPGDRRLTSSVIIRTWCLAGPDRLADDRHGAGHRAASHGET